VELHIQSPICLQGVVFNEAQGKLPDYILVLWHVLVNQRNELLIYYYYYYYYYYVGGVILLSSLS
jgi:Zn-dependent M16 (insulinase) family peptidase